MQQPTQPRRGLVTRLMGCFTGPLLYEEPAPVFTANPVPPEPKNPTLEPPPQKFMPALPPFEEANYMDVSPLVPHLVTAYIGAILFALLVVLARLFQSL